jgi:soluble lytic murein transglycosylase-like protein
MTVKDAVTAIATAQNLDPVLLAAQVLQESAGDPAAFRYEPAFYKTYIKGNVNAKAAAYGPLAACSYGLLQIMLEVAMERGFTGRPEDLFLPDVGLLWGTQLLKALLVWSGGNYPQALAAYNGGKGGNGAPPYRNQSYVDGVMSKKGLLLP